MHKTFTFSYDDSVNGTQVRYRFRAEVRADFELCTCREAWCDGSKHKVEVTSVQLIERTVVTMPYTDLFVESDD